jgi:hypothetical protein
MIFLRLYLRVYTRYGISSFPSTRQSVDPSVRQVGLHENDELVLKTVHFWPFRAYYERTSLTKKGAGGGFEVRLNPLFLLVAGTLAATPTFAGPAVVGVATAIGSFSVNNSSVSGTANLPDGALLRTTVSTGQVTLKGGSNVVLGTNSAANFYDRKVVMVQGMARFDNMKPDFKIAASSLRVENDQVGGQGAVRLNGDKVEVASVIGNMNVYNQEGVLLARVPTGSVFAVADNQSGATQDCTGSHKNDPGCAAVPSGASGGAAAPMMSNGAALWIAGGLAALGLGLGIGLSQSGGSSKSSSP